jgi:aminomethyltransferase
MTEIATPEPIATPLLDRHEALGAKIVEFAGWLMPISYAGILEEHRAVRSAAGLFDLSHMGELVVEGPEAGVALAAALVTDPPSLAVGRAHYSMICAPDGGILDDLIVYRLAPERFMVVANASNARTVSDALAERLDGFGAVLDDRSLATGLVAIQGPRSLEILQPLAGVDLASIRYYGIAEGVVAGIPAQVARTGYTGEDGFELFVDVERAGEAWDAVLDAGRPLGLVAGMPLYGNELDRSTTPYEAGLERVVKLAKAGEFTGRAALEKVAADGVRRRLVGLVLRGRGIARHGYPVLDADGVTGVVTSGTMSPTLGVAIAMAYVAPRHAQPGTMLDVEIRGARVAAEVVPLPFYKRPA